MDRPVRGDRDAVHQGVDRIPQEFETRYQGHVQEAAGEPIAESARMIVNDFPGPAMDERARVEILNASNPKQVGVGHA